MKLNRLLSTSLVFAALFAGLTPTLARANETDFDQRPVPVKTPPPEYPSEMRKEGAAGTVAVKVLVDETGNVVECVVSKSTRAEFEQAALAAVRNWKFKPASKAGTPVKARFILPITFNVDA